MVTLRSQGRSLPAPPRADKLLPYTEEAAMRIGINGTGLLAQGSISAIADHAAKAAADGFASYWLAEHPLGGVDALTALTVVAQSVPGIELGTAIVPTWPRHPMVMAAQAATANQAMGGRLALGIGLSHQVMLEQLGIPMEKPIRHLREYLSILMPLLRDGKVSFEGETLSCRAELFAKPAGAPPVLVAALGPQALRVTGRLADGTSLAWVGPRTVREHIAPTLRAAAAEAGRPAPRIVATLPLSVTRDVDAARARARKAFSTYGALPSYREMCRREGVEQPADLVILGGESEVEDRLGELAAAGVTDFSAGEFGRGDEERERTRTLLRSLAASASVAK
jgi:F420-dependent oxidoreductase-like protein